MNADAVCARIGVSRETRERLEAYVATLLDWQTRINLVGRNTIGDIWHRHILDCAQIARFVPPSCRRLVDIGSGAGLPGVILAILGVRGVELIESDRKKAAFLHAAAGAAGVTPVIHTARAQALPAEAADVVTARAVAPLERLVPMVARFMAEGSLAILPKGAALDDELKAAAQLWHMWYSRQPSVTQPGSSLLLIDRLYYDGHR
ncbi:MAG: 16S rRNA (guanine(527)-N(7))-methyltransferase RsmG [Rhodospirillales bacterium]|nr:16S rRNA (guanine(527)-N(7))-methyltransferase RsmG [Rhodospirillales bacterium]